MSKLDKYALYWTLIGLSFLVVLVSVLVNPSSGVSPGMTFISLTHTIFPAIIFIVCAILPVTSYRELSIASRIIALLHSGAALALLSLLVVGTWGLFMEPFNRGHLFGW
jgi:hypothetical protein